MNLTRVVWSDDAPALVSNNFTEVKKFFKGLTNPEDPHSDFKTNRNMVSSIYLYIYDDKYSVEEELGWDIIIVDKDTNEAVDYEDWIQRLPWQFYCQPLDLGEFKALNREYCDTHNIPFIHNL